MITIKDLLDYSIDTNHSLTAHICYWAMTTQNVQLTDDSSVLDTLDYDSRAITQLVEQNVLGLGQIKLFVISVSKVLYAFYFARNGLEATAYHQRLFGQYERIVEAPRLMYKLMYMQHIDEELFLNDYRKQVVEFPAYIGHAYAGENILQRLNQQRQVSQVV